MKSHHVKLTALFVLSVLVFWFLMSKPERTTCLSSVACPPVVVCPQVVSPAHETRQGLDDRICFPEVTEDPTEKRGQIDETTGFGKKLAEIAGWEHVKLVIEIGTWFGGGSSYVMAKAIDRPGNCVLEGTKKCCERLVITLELFEPAWRHARAFLQNLPIWCILGTTVGASDMLSPDEIPDKGEHYQLYYERDRALLASHDPLLRGLCDAYSPDLVLIDGNEYTGFAEYQIVSKVSQPQYLAIHDASTLKTMKIEAELREPDAPYRILAHGTDRGASWVIYERNG